MAKKKSASGTRKKTPARRSTRNARRNTEKKIVDLAESVVFAVDFFFASDLVTVADFFAESLLFFSSASAIAELLNSGNVLGRLCKIQFELFHSPPPVFLLRAAEAKRLPLVYSHVAK